MKTITLATLPQTTEQEVFYYVAHHLLTQNEKSLAKSDNFVRDCLYKNPDNLKCAAGCLIADDEYKPDLEGLSWRVLADYKDVPLTHINLIASLQIVHDKFEVKNWRLQLSELANDFGLKFNEGVQYETT